MPISSVIGREHQPGGGILPHRDHRPAALTRAACAGGRRPRQPSQQADELIEGLRSHNIDRDVIMIPNEIQDLARYEPQNRAALARFS